MAGLDGIWFTTASPAFTPRFRSARGGSPSAAGGPPIAANLTARYAGAFTTVGDPTSTGKLALSMTKNADGSWNGAVLFGSDFAPMGKQPFTMEAGRKLSTSQSDGNGGTVVIAAQANFSWSQLSTTVLLTDAHGNKRLLKATLARTQ